MDFRFTPDNAADFVKILSPIFIIIVTYIFTKTNWKKVYKAALVFAISAIIAILNSYAEGTLQENFWSNFTTIFTLTQIGYWGLMKAAGIEEVISPKEALASKAGNELNQQINEISKATVASILNPNEPPALSVDATIVNSTGDIKN